MLAGRTHRVDARRVTHNVRRVFSKRRSLAEERHAAERQAAEAAGLRYVLDDQPGIRRIRNGAGFSYVWPEGRPVDEPDALSRIASLAVPPAYEAVWICPDPLGHIQATGRDARGRKQYRYHPEWRRIRDDEKFSRMLAFAAALPRIRRRVDTDLRLPGLPRNKVLAAVVRLLEHTVIRVGNDEYARANASFGLTTLENRHVTVQGARLTFRFRGKGGKRFLVEYDDPRISSLVKRWQSLPGRELFQYVDESGGLQRISSGDVNEYLRRIAGEPFSAKDFRTWIGTLECAAALGDAGLPATKAQRRRNVRQALMRTAERLGNTPAVCRKAYVHPALLETYERGTPALQNGARRGSPKFALNARERALVAFLRSIA